MAADAPSPRSRWRSDRSPRNAVAGGFALALAGLSCVWAVMVVAGDPSGSRIDTDAEMIAKRRALIEQMSDAEKDSLARALERFQELDPSEQQRLRRLRQKIESSSNSAELEQVVHGYYDWLATLTPGKRSEIQALPPKERMAAVVRELQEEARRNQERLSLQDYIVLADWLRDEFESRLLETVPEKKRQKFTDQSPTFRRATIVYMLARRMRDDGWRLLETLSAESLDTLTSRLSPSSRELLVQAGSLDAQRRVVARWVYGFVHRSVGQRQLSSLLSDVSDAELTEFFEKELSDEQRESLLSLSPEEMWHDLRVEYVRKQLPMPELIDDRPYRGRGDYRGGNPGGRPDGRPGDRSGNRPDNFDRRPPPPGGPTPPGRSDR